MMNKQTKTMDRTRSPISPSYDPWDPIRSLRDYGRHVLTSVELTVTNLCNMRCEHCAVGDSLVLKEPEQLPLPLILKSLDEVEYLQTISITGGEPTFRRQTVEEKIIPLLKYAKARESARKSIPISRWTTNVTRSCFLIWMSCISRSTIQAGTISMRSDSLAAGTRSSRKSPTKCSIR